MRRLVTVLFLVALCPLQACGMQYSAEPIEAWVIDAETNQPLEGVIVVAHWQLYGGLHPDNAGELTILETVTDKAGRFNFPAWGPKALPSGAPSNARLTFLDPEILIFKIGYTHQRVANELTSDALKNQGPPLRRSRWNGKKIKMEKLDKLTLKDLDDLNGDLKFLLRNPENCNWRYVPKTILAIRDSRLELAKNGIRPAGWSTLDEDLIENSRHYASKGGAMCGSPRDMFKGPAKSKCTHDFCRFQYCSSPFPSIHTRSIPIES